MNKKKISVAQVTALKLSAGVAGSSDALAFEEFRGILDMAVTDAGALVLLMEGSQFVYAPGRWLEVAVNEEEER